MKSGAFSLPCDPRRHPTVFLSAVSTLIFLLPSVAPYLEYDRAAIASGETWRLVTGHLVHYSFDHFFWDAITFLALGAACERFGATRLLACLAASALAISASIWLCLPSVATYRGLSGVDSALFGLLIAASGRTTLSVICLAGFFLKMAFELATGQTIFVTNLGSGAVGVPLAHLVGAAAGLAAGSSRRFVFSRRARMPFCTSPSTLPRIRRPVKPVRPSDRLRLTFTNQNPRPRI